MRKLFFPFFLTLLLLLQPLSAKPQSEVSAVKEADALFQAQDWEKAAKAYEALTKADPTIGRSWYRLGYSLHALGRFGQAIEAYKKAVAINQNPIAMYNLACSYSRNKENDQALDWLNKGVDAGFTQVDQMKADSDLAALQSDSRFKSIVAKAERYARPCAASPEFRQFDFWIGEWEVKNPQGQTVGTNSVQLILGDCVIFENWSSGQGGHGKSFNFFNTKRGKWQQTWVDDKGTALELMGELKDGAMAFTGETVTPKGVKTEERLTFFKLSQDSVRQLWEQSTDGGKNWKVAFDGLYIRKK